MKIQNQSNQILKMMRQKFKKIKEKITGKEIVLRLLTIMLVIILVYYSEKSEREIVNVIGFSIAFLTSIYLHKHFFPMMTATTLFYLLASTQQLYSGDREPPIIDVYWSIGNVLLILSILNFAYKLIFKYKIVENENDQTHQGS